MLLWELSWVCFICSWTRIVRWDSVWTGNCFQLLQWELKAILDRNLTFLKSLCESQCALRDMHSLCVIFLWKHWNTGFQIQIPGDFLQVSDKVVLVSLARDYWLCKSHMLGVIEWFCQWLCPRLMLFKMFCHSELHGPFQTDAPEILQSKGSCSSSDNSCLMPWEGLGWGKG